MAANILDKGLHNAHTSNACKAEWLQSCNIGWVVLAKLGVVDPNGIDLAQNGYRMPVVCSHGLNCILVR
jgi:hypothetical protein